MLIGAFGLASNGKDILWAVPLTSLARSHRVPLTSFSVVYMILLVPAQSQAVLNKHAIWNKAPQIGNKKERERETEKL